MMVFTLTEQAAKVREELRFCLEVSLRQERSLRASRPVRHSWALPAAILTVLLFLPPAQAPAQTSTAAVRGSVRDQTGAPVPAATVTARNLETGLSRTTNSDEQGVFEILQLAPGAAEVQIAATGYAPQTRKGLELRSGQPVTLDFVMGPSSASASGANANRIDESQLAGLPLNGRSYSQLATLQAGVSDPSAASGSRGIGGGGLTVAGGRSTSNTFLLDGTNIMDVNNQAPRSAGGVQLGSDAVLQVQVLSSNFGAEYGRGSGGVLNSITRSGTPEFHADFFEFFRNSKLDARNFFDPGKEPTPFKRNQFGFTMTGPVRKERTFLIGSFEAMRDRLTETDTSFFPDKSARLGFPDENGEPTIPVNPNVQPYLDLYPVPNGEPLGGGIGENSAPRFFPTDENFFTVRLDHQISDRDSFFARYNFDDATSVGSGGPTFLFLRKDQSRQQYLTLVESHVFNLGLLNAFRFGYTRPTRMGEVLSALQVPPELLFLPGATEFGLIEIPGVSGFGTFMGGPQADIVNSFQFSDDLVAQRGAHTLKLGVEVHRYRWNVFSSSFKGANWSFNSLESFLEGGPQGTTLSVALPGSDNRVDKRQTLTGFYFQDSFQVRPNFQFNLGLRYEFTTLIHDTNGKTSFLADRVRDSEVQIGPILETNPSLRNLAPRLGFSWSPGSSRNTVIRGGFGIYYDQIVQYLVDQTKNTLPFYKVAVRTNFDSSETFPNAVAAAVNVPLRVQGLDYKNTTSPMVLRYNFELQQLLSGGWHLGASYVGARGNHLFRKYEANLIPVPDTLADGTLFFPDDCNDPLNLNPSELCRPGAGPVNPAFGSIGLVNSDAQSFYNSLRLSARKSLSRGISLQASYTFSKSVDDASTHDRITAQYGPLRTLERGLSDFDIRHRLAINYFYALPFGSGQRWWNSGALSSVFGGWRLGGIVRFRTGTPFTAQVNLRSEGFLFAPARPNLRPGASSNTVEGVTAGCDGVDPGRKLGGRELYFDPCVFEAPPPGTLGNVGRNILTGPGVFNIDVSLQKEFVVDAKKRLAFRAEFFNLPNHTNFAQNEGGSTIIFSGAGSSRNSRAGRIGGTSTTARQIQFALRFSF